MHIAIMSKSTFSQPFKTKCVSKVVRIGRITIVHLRNLWKAKFFILCAVIFLVRLQWKFEIDHSWVNISAWQEPTLDQFQFQLRPLFRVQEWSISNFSCSLPRNITSHSMKNLPLHSLLRWNMIILPIPTTSLIHFSLEGWENVLFKRGSENTLVFPSSGQGSRASAKEKPWNPASRHSSNRVPSICASTLNTACGEVIMYANMRHRPAVLCPLEDWTESLSNQAGPSSLSANALTWKKKLLLTRKVW